VAKTIHLTGLAGESVEINVNAFRLAHHGEAVLSGISFEIIRPNWEEGPYTIVVYAQGIEPEATDAFLSVRVQEWLDEIQARLRAAQQS